MYHTTHILLLLFSFSFFFYCLCSFLMCKLFTFYIIGDNNQFSDFNFVFLNVLQVCISFLFGEKEISFCIGCVKILSIPLKSLKCVKRKKKYFIRRINFICKIHLVNIQLLLIVYIYVSYDLSHDGFRKSIK